MPAEARSPRLLNSRWIIAALIGGGRLVSEQQPSISTNFQEPVALLLRVARRSRALRNLGSQSRHYRAAG